MVAVSTCKFVIIVPFSSKQFKQLKGVDSIVLYQISYLTQSSELLLLN